MGGVAAFPICQWREGLSSASLNGLRKWALDRGARNCVRAFQPFLEESDDPPFVVGSFRLFSDSLDSLLQKERCRFSPVLSPLSVEEGEALCDGSSAPFLWQIEGSFEPVLCIPSLLLHKTKQGMDGRSIVLASQKKLQKSMAALGLEAQETYPASFWEKKNLMVGFSQPNDPWVMAGLLSACFWALHEHGALLRASCYTCKESSADQVWRLVLDEGAKDLLPKEFSFDGASQEGSCVLRLYRDRLEIVAEGASHHLISAVWNAALSDGLTRLSYKKDSKDLLNLLREIRPSPIGPAEFCHAFLTPTSMRCLEGVISSRFVPLCHDIVMKRFAQKSQDYLRKILDFFNRSVWPLMEKKKKQLPYGLMQSSFQIAQDLERILQSCHDLGWEARIQVLLELGNPKALFLQKKILEYQSIEKNQETKFI